MSVYDDHQTHEYLRWKLFKNLEPEHASLNKVHSNFIDELSGFICRFGNQKIKWKRIQYIVLQYSLLKLLIWDPSLTLAPLT